MKLVRALLRFDGRLRRRDWWLLSALVLIVQIVAGIGVAALLAGVGVTARPFIDAAVLTISALLQWPSAALNVRRFHDRDRRGWPGVLYVGVLTALGATLGLAGTSLPALMQREDGVGAAASALVMLAMPVTIWMFAMLALADGTRGPNRYGPAPKPALNPAADQNA